jgi:serine phosphatase RsbU (regulator of sigma subunit)/ligand-binding sensor domain-containing protein
MSSEDHVSIEGTLLMLDDATPHVAVAVQAIQDGKVIATTLSDESGKYQFDNLEPGQYQLRCQVLGGYVYYRATSGALHMTRYEDETSQLAIEEDAGKILRTEHGKTLGNIDFRFTPFKKGTWRAYTYLDGLADNNIMAIHRDPRGMLWFATFGGGVSRYDGRTFTNLTTEDGLADNHVVMWFGTRGGVCRYDGSEFVNFTTADGLPYNVVTCIQADPYGTIWFGTLYGVSRYDGKEFINLTAEDGLVHDRVYAIHCDSDGVVWFGTRGGVSRYDGNEFVNFTTRDGLADNKVRAVHRASDGTIWFGTEGGGVSRYDGREFINFAAKDGLVDDNVWAIHQDPDGAMWFATFGGGVSRYDGKGLVNFVTADGLVNNIQVICCDEDGVLWFGTKDLGVFRYDEKEFISFATEDGLGNYDVTSISCAPDGAMWFGTYGGAARYDGRDFVNFTTEDGLAHDWVNDVHCDSHGMLWFGTYDGVSRYDGKEFLNLNPRDGLEIAAVYVAPDGTLWFGSETDGLYRYDDRAFVSFTLSNGLADDPVLAINAGTEGSLWFGTSGGGVTVYNGEEFANFTTEDGLASDIVNAISCNSEGILWIGTDGGLSRYDGREFVNLTIKDGLVHNKVNAVYTTPDGLLWLGTFGGGIAVYDGTCWTSLDTRDGLANNVVQGICSDADGDLWFATQGGITRYRRSNMIPQVHIVSVTTDRVHIDLDAVPAFSVGARIIIKYSSIDFRTVPEKRQYRCRISEIDSDWGKPTKSDTFDYAFDSPGRYTFEVQTIDRDLNYSEPASVKLEVIPDPRNHQIAQLKGELAERERAELERVHQELEDARQIQQSLLPESPPRVEGFEIAGVSLPAKEVSGDFYSYLSLEDNVAVVLADVTGKSVKAAMVAALADGILHTAVRERRDVWSSPGIILREVNTGLQPRLIRGMFTAMSLGILQVEQKRLLFSNAGMPYPIVKRGREVWELTVNGLPLGITDAAEYDDLSVDLEDGDFVVFYSDGVIEAESEAGEMYQTERLLELIQQADPGISAQEMVDLIVRDVRAFVGDVEPSDDITVVVIRRPTSS